MCSHTLFVATITHMLESSMLCKLKIGKALTIDG